ncbi:hypothetical protein [Microbispora siamensis]|uniref:NUDIX domain-containing protein n=1 Tax=Microbispora siamensis TaxID=564413 RepID=A0ABQ4GGG1_9ACTN|nr:hypothetical protein [Microbispora siamensis]GIH60533.1 hypothetical protein Msi02_13500 [Microbispora siamensis]
MSADAPVTPVCLTRGGRPAFVVNVEVFLERDGRWLLIRRGAKEAHAPGMLAGVGGKVEADGEAEGDPHCPPWISRSLRRATAQISTERGGVSEQGLVSRG